MSEQFFEHDLMEWNFSPRKLPPLRIHHFMLWTVVAALMLTVFKTEEKQNEFSSSMHASGIPSTLVYSVCLTGLVLGVYWKRQGHFFFDEPGQKAFILHGLFAIASVVAAACSSYGAAGVDDAEQSGTTIFFSVLSWLVAGLVQLVLYFRYGKQFDYLPHWGKFFYAVGTLTVLQYAVSIFLPFLFLLGAGRDFGLMMLGLLVGHFVLGLIEMLYWYQAVRNDYQGEDSYHWTHWLGVATWPIFRLIQIGTLMLTWLFMPDL